MRPDPRNPVPRSAARSFTVSLLRPPPGGQRQARRESLWLVVILVIGAVWYMTEIRPPLAPALVELDPPVKQAD